MFKKLHFQLTLLSTLITGIIVIGMTCALLYTSENSLSKNEYWNFVSSMSAVQAHLKTETNLSTEWLAQTENNHQIILYIEDNGIPIHYNQGMDDDEKKLVNQAKVYAIQKYDLNISNANTSKVVSRQAEFKLAGAKSEYFTSISFIPKSNGFIGVIALYSLDQFHKDIFVQRFIYSGIGCITLIALWFFSYFFTKRFIKPVEQSQKKQAEFIASASHELRSPLTVITSSMSAMKKSDTYQRARFEEMIDAELKRMTRLVSDMLSIASADSDTWSLNMEDTDLDTLLLNIFEAYQPIAAEKNIHFSISLPDTLTTCKCDKQRIEQVLSILIDNALSYTPSDGKVNLSIKQKPHGLEIHVADTGIGISDADKARIFDRFYRADVAHKSKDHFGLGLCIAYEIVKLHKGTLMVTDTSSGGATFIISLSTNS
jgi:signal transduction histidine kinase